MLYVRDGSQYRLAKDTLVLKESVKVAKRVLDSLPDLSTPEKAKDILVPLVDGNRNEVFYGAFLNGEGQMIAFEELFSGSLHSTPCFPRLIAERCFFHNASGLIIMHNHPTGLCKPSDADIDTTVKLKALLHGFEVDLHDHYVVSREGICSIREQYGARMQEERRTLEKQMKSMLLSSIKEGNGPGDFLEKLLGGLKKETLQ